jgi:hypothetical protein
LKEFCKIYKGNKKSEKEKKMKRKKRKEEIKIEMDPGKRFGPVGEVARSPTGGSRIGTFFSPLPR